MQATVTILETNFVVEYEFTITTSGTMETSPSFGSGGEPAEAAEFDITVTEICVPKQHADVCLDLPDWLGDLIATHLCGRDDINDIVQQADRDRGSDDDHYEE